MKDESGKMKVRASERDASFLAIAQRAQPKIDEVKDESFILRSYPFGQLAQLYYPDRSERSAIRLFREELKETRGLWDALSAVGYKPYCKILTRGQVKTIVKFLGEP